MSDSSDRNRLQLIEMYRDNPAAAARDLLGVDLAPHQRVILKAMWDCDNVIAILSRGSGKCVTGDTFINTSKGIMQISDLFSKDQLYKPGYYDCNEKIFGENGYQQLNKIYVNDKKPIIKIVTENGYELKAVDKHCIRCIFNGKVVWRRMDELAKGDYAILSKYENYDHSSYSSNGLASFRYAYLKSCLKSYWMMSRTVLRCYSKDAIRGNLAGRFDTRGSLNYNTGASIDLKYVEEAKKIQIILLWFGIIAKRDGCYLYILRDYLRKFIETFCLESEDEMKRTYYELVYSEIKKEPIRLNNIPYFADKIIDIQILPEEFTYDVCLNKDHTFISNGFISHNTFIDGVFATLRALLFPGERVGMFSSSFRQCSCLNINDLQIFTDKGMFSNQRDFLNSIECGKTKIQSLLNTNTILKKYINKKDECKLIKTGGMFSFCGLSNHSSLFFTQNGLEYKLLNNVVVGDYIPIRIGFNCFGNTIDLPIDNYKVTGYDNPIKIPAKMTKDFAYFLGIICGDGCITKNTDGKCYRICFVTADKELEDKYIGIMNNVFGVENISIGRKKKDDGSYSNCNYYDVSSKHLYNFLEQCGLSNCGATNKSIPEVIKKAPKEFVCEFLKGLFDTNGFVSYSCKRTNSLMIGLSTSSKQMAEEVRAMLLNLGIFAKITVSLKEGEKEVIKGKVSKVANNYRVYFVGKKDINLFINCVSFNLSRKLSLATEWIKSYKGKEFDVIPRPNDLIERVFCYFEKNKIQVKPLYEILHYRRRDTITRNRIDKLINFLKNIDSLRDVVDKLSLFANKDIVYEKVLYIETVYDETFDIEVANEHCYWAGGFIHHNSKFIFDEVCKLYEISPILRDACDKKPTKMIDMCYLQFKGYNNRPGSVIHALPLGSSGATIRGARYFTVIGDEAAQIPSEILDVVIRGMMATSKNPMEQVRALEEQKKLLEAGKIDKIQKLHQNKLVLSSTAYYQYNHLWKRVELFIKILMEKVAKAKKLADKGLVIPDDLKVELKGHDLNAQIPYNVMKDNNRALIACSYEDMPEGFMNTESIEEAKIQMPHYQFLMEYCFSKARVILQNGDDKDIKDVELGEKVWTHNHRWRRVVAKSYRLYTGRMFRLYYPDGNVVEVTENHKFLYNGIFIGINNILTQVNPKTISCYPLYHPVSFSYEEYYVKDCPVYDLQVEEDNSFTIFGATVHNCSLFPADSDGFFPMSVLDKARSHGLFSCASNLPKNDNWINIMSCDPARSGDNFAIAIFTISKETKKIRLVRVLTYNKKPFPYMHLEIRTLIRDYNISEIVIDSGGGGRTIRDLLADAPSCPVGEEVILQIDFDEHKFKKGRKILRLVEFSDYEWLSNANNNMLLGLQNGTFQIACEKGALRGESSNYDESPEEEIMRKEIDRTLEEMQNIVVTRTSTGRMHWDTPHRNQRKDRYSAVLIGYDAAYNYIDNLTKPQKLTSGFWI